MAYTRFADIPNFSPAAVAAAIAIDPAYNNDALLDSAIVKRSARLDALANAASPTLSVPFLNPLDSTIEQNVASPDESIMADIHGLTGGTQTAVTHFRDQVWGANRLLSGIKGINAIAEIASRVARYELDQKRKQLAVMLKAISITSGAQFTSDKSDDAVNLKALLAGKQTFGDAKGKVRTVVMSSLQHYYLQENQVGFKSGSETDTEFGTIGALRIIMTDDMPDDLVALVADEGFLYGKASAPSSPSLSYQSEERAARGWGTDIIVSREQYIFTPQGYNFVGSIDPLNASPTFAEMANGNDWQLIPGVPRKAIPFGFVKVATTPKTSGE